MAEMTDVKGVTRREKTLLRDVKTAMSESS